MRKGFTLIEISIVIIIIGLLISGILVGRDLIRAAEIRKQVAQIESYNTAVMTFKTKYNCIPGDCKNATNFGIATGSGYGTNGNGDGMVVDLTEAGAFWYHLARSGLISWSPPASDPGAAHPCNNGGNNVSPCLSMAANNTAGQKGGFWIYYGRDPVIEATLGGFELFTAFSGGPLRNVHYWWLTGSISTGMGANIFFPKDAYAIDAKSDDGLPYSGSVLATSYDTWIPYGPVSGTSGSGPGAEGCANGDTTPYQYNVKYDWNTDQNLCGLLVRSNF